MTLKKLLEFCQRTPDVFINYKKKDLLRIGTIRVYTQRKYALFHSHFHFVLPDVIGYFSTSKI